MNQVFKWCLLFRDLCLIPTMFSGYAVACMTRRPNVSLFMLDKLFEFHIITVPDWLFVTL